MADESHFEPGSIKLLHDLPLESALVTLSWQDVFEHLHEVYHKLLLAVQQHGEMEWKTNMIFRADCRKQLNEFKFTKNLRAIRQFLTPMLVIDKLLYLSEQAKSDRVLRDNSFLFNSINGLSFLKGDWMNVLSIFEQLEEMIAVRELQTWSTTDSRDTGVWLLHGLLRSAQYDSIVSAETNIVYAAIHLWWLFEGNLELPADLTQLPILKDLPDGTTLPSSGRSVSNPLAHALSISPLVLFGGSLFMESQVTSRLKLLKVHKGLGNVSVELAHSVTAINVFYVEQ
ncbi:hypothetical protein D9758_018151 [Tetrapyrgos nigripes]|uniref:Uncharacterized protein n=1 Tax=Tetrapyrgos nigripes TaxID=182062 RepID=A0A8H5BC18_9AGAR|nr:hypothetical protein D9758_018151 [Tetrapyrgos nigripes]